MDYRSLASIPDNGVSRLQWSSPHPTVLIRGMKRMSLGEGERRDGQQGAHANLATTRARQQSLPGNPRRMGKLGKLARHQVPAAEEEVVEEEEEKEEEKEVELSLIHI